MKEYKRLTNEELNDFTSRVVVQLEPTLTQQVMSLILELTEYRTKIENGTLIELPCKVGTTIYHLYKAGNVITEDKVFNYHFEICTKPCVSFENHFWYGTNKRVDTILVEQFGKYWFTDKAEAEEKLKELQSNE